MLVYMIHAWNCLDSGASISIILALAFYKQDLSLPGPEEKQLYKLGKVVVLVFKPQGLELINAKRFNQI